MKSLLWRLRPLNEAIYRLTGWAVNAYESRGNGFRIAISYRWLRESPYEW